MVGLIVMGVFAAGFLALAVAFWFEKGSWLISGYNTASPQEKARFDRHKLCRAMSLFCAVVAMAMLGLLYQCWRVESGRMAEAELGFSAIAFVVVVIGGLVAVQVYVKKRGMK